MSSLSFWLILLAPLATSAHPVKPGDYSKQEASGQFWHISDLHLDFSYHLTEDHTKVCLSSKGANASSPGIFGDFMCDSPYGLILSAIQYIKASEQKVDFMIWTGDSPPHVPVKELSTKLVIDIIGNMTSTIHSLLPDMLVFPALGNHDYWPQDQFPVSGSEVYTAVAAFWKPWLCEEALSTFRKGGYYSQIFKSNGTSHPLRIISLNTNLYYSPNKVTFNMTDPADQFQWLEETLKLSRQNNEKAYVIAHVPIGYLPFTLFTSAMEYKFNEKLVKIFRTYNDVIAGQFYGHTHRDSFMVVLDEKDKPVGSAFVAPAVTPIKSSSEKESNNPGFRLYQYDTNSYSLKDLWHYYLNLTDANLRKEALWKLEYIMTTEYNIKDLQPESLKELVLRFRKPQSVDFQKYYKNYLVNFDSPDGCDTVCKDRQVCAIQYVDGSSYLDCLLDVLKYDGIQDSSNFL
ncbi:acid sphingomyelinase-like phosphodiesterase 3a [Bufo gargarizans]|uniref:acid sphingomyelinase-like phosphodiesterase 3a n=1 Tax=Bufo gargarizans TaxID=30331 RepID=UPI001CF25DF4|nr:acid sphingomyelinase-like phosphodiesterase 3a [Bufo gargarizans]